MLRLLQSGEFRVGISTARLSLCPLRPRLSLAGSDLDTDREPPVEKLLSVGKRASAVSSKFRGMVRVTNSLAELCLRKVVRDSIGA